MVGAFVRWRGPMNHKGSKEHEGHEGAGGNMDDEEVAKRVIGMAIKMKNRVSHSRFRTWRDSMVFGTVTGRMMRAR